MNFLGIIPAEKISWVDSATITIKGDFSRAASQAQYVTILTEDQTRKLHVDGQRVIISQNKISHTDEEYTAPHFSALSAEDNDEIAAWTFCLTENATFCNGETYITTNRPQHNIQYQDSLEDPDERISFPKFDPKNIIILGMS
jgi:hypothetical protein